MSKITVFSNEEEAYEHLKSYLHNGSFNKIISQNIIKDLTKKVNKIRSELLKTRLKKDTFEKDEYFNLSIQRLEEEQKVLEYLIDYIIELN